MRDADGIRFILNDRDIEVRDGAPDATLLDFLRGQLRLTGTKEGCAEEIAARVPPLSDVLRMAALSTSRSTPASASWRPATPPIS